MTLLLVVLVLTGAACSPQVTGSRPLPTTSAPTRSATAPPGAPSVPSPAAPRHSAPSDVPASPTGLASLPATPSPSPTTPTPAAPPDTVQTALAGMSPAQRVGQLFMIGTPATEASRQTLRQIRRYHLGSVILTGRSHDGSSGTARVAAALQARTGPSTAGVRLLVATDQEGGAVQVLQGAGLTQMPSALEQGSWSPGRLHKAAARWARQLRRAGVNMNLAPVLDTVPGPGAAPGNAPIGAYGREYGFTPGSVARHGLAFARGMAEHGVAPTVKHFPGLGRVHGNTDYSSGVVDSTTRRDDPYLAPFRRAIRAGVPFVMMSTAYYRHLDPDNPAAFSRFVIETMLRGDLGFRGVVVSDDLANAQQVARWSYGQRALKFIAAGGDLVLAVDPAALPAMFHAVLHRARHDRSFRAKVRAAALHVLQAKQPLGLLRQPRS
jgi:beta-N-acetylhexosaminidase